MSYAIMGIGTYGGGGYAGPFGAYAGFGAADFSSLGPNPPTIKQGSTGAAVKVWDEFLGVAPAPPTFPFGPKTYTATVAWQKAHGLTADGVVGPSTWKAAIASQAAGGGAPGPAPTPGALPGMQPDGSMVVPAGGGGAPAPSGGGGTTANPLDKAKAWWGSQPKNTQYAIMGGGAIAVIGLLFLTMGGKKKPAAAMTPNRRARSRAHYRTSAKKRRRHRALTRRRHQAARYAPNRSRKACSPMKKRVKTCHCKPPKKYRRKGATARSDYAFPECYMYPIRFRKKGRVQHQLTVKHVRTAASRIGKFGRRYPAPVRKRIKSRIRAAERKYGIGPYRSR